MRPETLRALGLVLFLAGVVLVILGIVYFTVPVDSLPSLLGHAKGTGHHTKRGLVAIVVGILCWIAAPIALRRAVVLRRARRFQRFS